MAPTSRKRRPGASAAARGVSVAEPAPGTEDVGTAAGAVTAERPGADAAGEVRPKTRREREAERDALMRAALEPLAPGERPTPLRIAVVVCGLLSVGVLIGATTTHDLSSHGGSLLGGVFLACVLAAVCGGMWNRRYWAVLGFEALLAFQIIVSCLALTVVASLLVALVLVVVVGLSGWLFWKLVRVMGRIQVTAMREREPEPPAVGP
jgi:hypothetical protein